MNDSAKKASRAGSLALTATVSLCMGFAAHGIARLWGYSSVPGTPASAPRTWPEDQAAQRASKLPTLVILLHPHCPCSRATVDELSRLLAHTRGKLTTTILLVRPEGAPEGWENTDLSQAVSALPGVTVRIDPNGQECERFGAATSGQALLYSADGRLLFAGGITESRGHSGDNAGRSIIESLVLHDSSRLTRDEDASPLQTAVFGCPLFDPSHHAKPTGMQSCQR